MEFTRRNTVIFIVELVAMAIGIAAAQPLVNRIGGWWSMTIGVTIAMAITVPFILWYHPKKK